MEEKTRYHFNNTYFDAPLRFGDVSVIQIGRRYCAPSEIIAAHPHLNWFEITVVTAGKCVIVTNGQSHELSAGEIYLSFPCDIHEIQASETEKFEYDFFSFFADDEKTQSSLEEITRNYRSPKKRTFRDDKITALIGYALGEFSTDKGESKEVLTSLFNLIVSYIIRDFNRIPQETSDISDAKILCLQLMNYIDTHVYSLTALESVSEPFGYNYNYLSTLFSKTTGNNLSDYYRMRRGETAKTLLAGNKKIGEIAEMLRYSSPFAFSKAFKRQFGISPKEYRCRRLSLDKGEENL